MTANTVKERRRLMNATQYTKIMGLIATARENAERLQNDMRSLNRHGGEDAYANSDVVFKDAEIIEKDLDKAITVLREVQIN